MSFAMKAICCYRFFSQKDQIAIVAEPFLAGGRRVFLSPSVIEQFKSKLGLPLILLQ